MHIIPRWDSYPFSGLLPELYYNVHSPEQRIKNLCKNMQKLIEYASETALTVNEQYEVVTELLENLPEKVDESVREEVARLIESGELEPILEEAASAWLEQRTEQIDDIEADLAAEVTTRASETSGLATDLAAETAAREAADTAEETARTAAISELASSLGDAAYMDVSDSVTEGDGNPVSGDAVHNAVATKRGLLKDKVIVCIGDSLTSAVGADHGWPYYLAQSTGCEVHNHAEGGAGFVNVNEGGRKFSNQLTTALADASYDNDSVTDVIIMGGYNDYAYAGQIADAAKNLVEAAAAGFENAVVHVGFCLHGIYPLDYALGGATAAQKRSLLISPGEWGARRGGACIIPQPWTWALGETGYKYDNVHVNDSGQLWFSQMVAAYLNNGSTMLIKQQMCEVVHASITSSNLRCYTQNGVVFLQGQFTTSAEIAVGETLFNLPGFAWRDNESNGFNLTCACWHDWHPADEEGSRVAIRGEVIASRYIGIGTTAIEAAWPMGY